MKILLIEPPFERFIGFRCEWFPMGLVSLATYLKSKGHNALVYNAEHDNSLPYLDLPNYSANFHQYNKGLDQENHKIWNDVKRVIEEEAPQIVGISVKTVKALSAIRVAKIARQLVPGVKIIVGGPHATVCYKNLLKSLDIDFVVHGEGELTLADLTKSLEQGTPFDSIQGISYKNNGQVISNTSRPMIKDLDILPYPDRSLLIDYKDYTTTQLGWLMASRGCPYDCSYCSSKVIWTRKVRYRPLESVTAEMRELASKYQVNHVNIMDDSFTVNRQFVFKFCDYMSSQRSKITWACLTRSDLLNEEMIEKIQSAGCRKVDIGIESGSPEVQKIINKEIDLDQVRKTAKLLNKKKMFWAGFFMMGFPGETKDDVLETLRFMKEVKPNWVCFSIFTPYPGTALYEKAKSLGLVDEETDFSVFAHQSPDNSFSEKIPKEEFKELVKMMLLEFSQYNSSFRSLLGRASTKNYLRNPGQFFLDLKKIFTWIRLL